MQVIFFLLNCGGGGEEGHKLKFSIARQGTKIQPLWETCVDDFGISLK